MPSLLPMLRGLRKQSGFSTLAVLTLALGIGVNVAIFSALEALVLSPLPYPDANRLVAIYEDSSWLGFAKNTPAPANYFDWKRASNSFEVMGATSGCRSIFTGGLAPEEVVCRNMTAGMWPVLGARPVLGRWFSAAEDHSQPDVIVIGEGLWTRRFARDPGILNRTVQVNGFAMQVVGIMPGWFQFGGERGVEMWMPIGFTPAQKAQRGSHYLRCFGRLKPGVTWQQAEAELKGIQAGIDRVHAGDTDSRTSVTVEPLRDALVGKTGPTLWILMAAAAMVLLIACANVANLLVARAMSRQHEMAVRLSLGASSTQLVSHVLLETAFLALAGGLAGVLLALWSRSLLENFIPVALKGTVAITLDARVFAFALITSLLAALLASMTPVLHVLRSPLMGLLRQDSRSGAGRGTMRLRSLLVTGEVALTVILLAGAGLMVRSMAAIWHTDLGFRPAKLMSVQISLPATKYEKDDSRYQFYDRARAAVSALPGVASADFASTPPFFSIGNSQGFAIEGRTPATRLEPSDMLVRVGTPGYLQTLGATLVAGRYFDEHDREDAPDVAIVNETTARTFYPTGAIGKRMSFAGKSDTARRWRTIVGVVKEVNERGYDLPAKPVTYVTTRQSEGWFAGQLVVRSTGPSPELLSGALRRAIQQLDPDQPIGLTRTFDQILALDQASRRQQMFLLLVFAGLSLVMACLGIYAVLAYSVELRRQEIGVRMALGADTTDVMKLVTRDGMTMAALGLAAGVAASLAGARLLRASLYEVKPFDPLTLAAVCATLALVALVACWIPAKRAAAVAPGLALRP